MQQYAVNGGLYPTDHGLVVYTSEAMEEIEKKDELIKQLQDALHVVNTQKEKKDKEIASLKAENKELRTYETAGTLPANSFDSDGNPIILGWTGSAAPEREEANHEPKS